MATSTTVLHFETFQAVFFVLALALVLYFVVMTIKLFKK